MKFTVNLDTFGNETIDRLEALNSIKTRLSHLINGRPLSDIDFQILPNTDNPKRVSFQYDGRLSANSDLERQFNGLNHYRNQRSNIHFLNLRDYLSFHKNYSKNGTWYARIPLHPRSRAGYHKPSETTGEVIFRTLSQNSKPGTWIAAVQQWKNAQTNLFHTPSRVSNANEINQKIELQNILNVPSYAINTPTDYSNINPLNRQNEVDVNSNWDNIPLGNPFANRTDLYNQAIQQGNINSLTPSAIKQVQQNKNHTQQLNLFNIANHRQINNIPDRNTSRHI